MKLLDKLISFIFSVVVLILAIAVIMVCLEYISVDKVYAIFDEYVFKDSVKEISFITAICAVLGALKTTIFNADFKKKGKEPILVETNHGVVEISQDTIDNTVRNTAYTFPEVKDVQARMIKKNKGIKIYVMISVLVNTNIRELTAKLQEKIGEVIDATTGVKVLSINIKVKNIYEKNKKPNRTTNEEKKSEVVEEVKEVEKESTKEAKVENEDTNDKNEIVEKKEENSEEIE